MGPSRPLDGKVRPTLTGVAETMLWPFWHRSCYAEGPLAILPDAMAVPLRERIAYPFRRRFGAARPWHALRARHGDRLIAAHLARWPGAGVVSLGDGLETQLWRLDPAAQTRWVVVDLPEAMAFRRRLLPEDPRLLEIAGTAGEAAWMEAVAPDPPPLVQAVGLFMYLDPLEVAEIIARLFRRFPAATLHFDTVPPVFAARTREGLQVTAEYRCPPMPWGIAHDAIEGFVSRAAPGARVKVRTYADAAPWVYPTAWWCGLVPALRNSLAPCLVTVEGPALAG